MDKETIKYVITILVQRGLGVLFYLFGAGWLMNSRATVYFISYVSVAAISLLIMVFVNAETLRERNKKNTDSPMWDKVLLGLFWLLAYFVIYLIAGIESDHVTESIGFSFWLGMIVSLISAAISLWALIVNTFLESTARIQKDRGQTVCQTGPYKIVRHPTYLALIIWCISIGLVFPTLGVMVCAITIATIIFIRTYLEDKMLQNGLSGYKEYAAKVKYRLVPYVW